MDNNLLPIINAVFDSTDDEEEELLPQIPQPPLLNANALHPILRMNRQEHIKINDYVENVVRQYMEKDFIMHFRLSREVAYGLVNRFSAAPMYTDLQVFAGFQPISSEKHILTYLWFVGHESTSYRDTADRFGITISALHNVITRVTNFLVSISPSIIRFPTLAEREMTINHYVHTKDFPGVVGSIDGTHVRIDKPKEDHHSYINRKQYFSIQLQGTVDHQKKFIDIFVGYPGSVHDARVFRESPLYTRLNEPCGQGNYLLGDSVYPCMTHLMVPYRDNGHFTRAQNRFNRRSSRCRVTVENTFAALKQRFRQLYHLKLRNVRIVQVIHACCVLHNLANQNDLELFEDPLNDDPVHEEHIQVVQVPQDDRQGRFIRDEICRQFTL